MTARYLGMNRSDGLTVTDLEHISQSIGDILRTPVGSRVMRRDYGSLLASMIDQPQTPALELQIKVACYMAVLKWELRYMPRKRRPCAPLRRSGISCNGALRSSPSVWLLVGQIFTRKRRSKYQALSAS